MNNGSKSAAAARPIFIELSNRETRTAKLVAEQLKRLGLEVQTGIAHTGVVGFLKGGLPGPTVAMHAMTQVVLDYLESKEAH